MLVILVNGLRMCVHIAASVYPRLFIPGTASLKFPFYGYLYGGIIGLWFEEITSMDFIFKQSQMRLKLLTLRIGG